MKRGQQMLWNIAPPALSIPLSARTSQFVATPIIPLAAGRKLLLWNIAATICAAVAADSLKIAADAVQIGANLNDSNGNVLSAIALIGNPWNTGSLVPFSSGGALNGLTVGMYGDPAVELRGNLAIMNPTNSAIQVVQSVQFIAEFELHNTDGAAAHSVFSALELLVSEEPLE